MLVGIFLAFISVAVYHAESDPPPELEPDLEPVEIEFSNLDDGCFTELMKADEAFSELKACLSSYD